MISRIDIEDMTDAQDEALLPCPFCGKDSVKIDDHSDPLGACFRIDHWCGGTVGGNFIAVEQDSKQDVAREWNRRADLARPSQAGDERVAEAVQRVAQYLGRRKKTRSDDPDFIHGYDVSPEGGFVLSASDLAVMVAALAAMDTPKGGRE